MSQSASQASKFYKDVESSGKIWTIRDDNGYPAPKNRDGKRSMPFWSSLSRVEKIIKNVEAYKGFKPVQLDIDYFYDYWLKELKKTRHLVGINWSGKNAIGYDLDPRILIKWIKTFRPDKVSWLQRLMKF